jgi:hypothetical protein
MFVVYPGDGGEPLESTRLFVFNEGLADMRAMQLCESYYSHEEVVAEIERIAERTIRFDNTVTNAKTVLAIRERINEMIKAKVG